MELIILVAIAVSVGYFLAGSKYSDKIDETTEKVTDTSKGWLGQASGKVRGWFGRDQKADIVDAEVTDVPEEQPAEESKQGKPEVKKPAEKNVSRRRKKTADSVEDESSNE